MKKLFISIVALLALVACSKTEEVDVSTVAVDDGLTFWGAFEGGDTRVSISEDSDGFKMAWSDDDVIAVYTRETKTQYDYNPETQVFTKTGDNTGAKLEDYYYAVFPYVVASQKINDGTITLDLPAAQSYAENSFGTRTNTMMAICPKPAEASSDPVQLQFKNVAGYLRLYLYGEDVTIKSIALSGNNNETLAGLANATIEEGANPELDWTTGAGQVLTLDCGDGVKVGSSEADATAFWFVVPPTVFENGFKVRIVSTDGRVMEQSLNTKFEIIRNTVETMSPLAVKFKEVDPNLILDVQFNEDGTATDNGIYLMNITSKVTSEMSVIKDPNFQYGNVLRCDRLPHNRAYPGGVEVTDLSEGYYEVDMNSNEYFKNALADGYTLEFVATIPTYGPDMWQVPFYLSDNNSNTTFIYRGGYSDGHFKTGYQRLKDDGTYGSFVANIMYPELNKYFHIMYVYDPDSSQALVYLNGNPKWTVVGAKPVDFDNARLIIAGSAVSSNLMRYRFCGDIGMVRIYNDVKSAEEISERYASLSIPVYAVNDAPEPMIDVQFNSDNTATNIGSDSSIAIETVNPTLTNLTVENGIAKFGSQQGEFTDGTYFAVDCTQNGLGDKFKDGYTVELVYALPDSGCRDGWKSVFGTDQFSYISGNKNATNDYIIQYWHPTENKTAEIAGSNVMISDLNRIEYTKYYHIFVVYKPNENGTTAELRFYSDGWLNSGNPWPANGDTGRTVNGETIYNRTIFPEITQLNAPSKLIIGGTYNGLNNANNSICRIWLGNLATFRVYDEALTNTQIGALTADMKPTVDALTATIAN